MDQRLVDAFARVDAAQKDGESEEFREAVFSLGVTCWNLMHVIGRAFKAMEWFAKRRLL